MDDLFFQHLRRGGLLVERQRYKEAEMEFHKALSIHPDMGSVHTSLANCILHQKNKERHHEAYQEARLGVVHDPENAFAYYTLGRILCVMDRLNAAEKILRKTVELSPDDADYHAMLAVVLLDLRRMKEARQELKRALAIDPENQSGLYVSALIEGSKGQVNEAAKYVKQLLRTAPDQSESHIALGRILMQTGIGGTAEDAFREALRIDPNNQEAHLGLMMSQKSGGAKEYSLLFDIVHGLFWFRWILMPAIFVILITMTRSCR
ncbi:MAG: tetratricopeptide repeat protein [Planctomycetaceae bacterium]|nr:tetratricopeptide repeat protein [Planctomycetaceae bacterium]